jgi:hypothetical protein
MSVTPYQELFSACRFKLLDQVSSFAEPAAGKPWFQKKTRGRDDASREAIHGPPNESRSQFRRSEWIEVSNRARPARQTAVQMN